MMNYGMMKRMSFDAVHEWAHLLQNKAFPCGRAFDFQARIPSKLAFRKVCKPVEQYSRRHGKI